MFVSYFKHLPFPRETSAAELSISQEISYQSAETYAAESTLFNIIKNVEIQKIKSSFIRNKTIASKELQLPLSAGQYIMNKCVHLNESSQILFSPRGSSKKTLNIMTSHVSRIMLYHIIA